jgi:hypothetical protein
MPRQITSLRNDALTWSLTEAADGHGTKPLARYSVPDTWWLAERLVPAMLTVPTGHQRVGRHMVALSTYLGHVNIEATYWYLQTTPELLVDIAAAGERFFTGSPS